MIPSWGQLLEPIPTRFLDRAYTRAMRDHCVNDDARAPFKAGLILKAYQQMSLSGTLEREQSGEQQRLMETSGCLHGCELGWIRMESQDGRSGVIPCPIHRS